MVITQAVGRGVANLNRNDVKLVQQLLNKHRKPPLRIISEDGFIGPETIAAIEEFQKRVVKLQKPDGRVDPQGITWKALTAGSPPTTSAAAGGSLSGSAWWYANQAKYPNSNSVEDLEPNFRAKAKEFLAALQQAGASVIISTTKRNKQRAYLMHYSWKIAKGQINASQVPADPGVNIAWDHGNDTKSKQAAQEMVNLFQMAHIASLTSRHIDGKAIDMSISWTGALMIKNKAGDTVQIGAPRKGDNNTALHTVGSTYGVNKLVTDAPHWSSDGH